MGDALLIFDDVIVQFIKTGFSDHSLSLTGELNPYLMGIAKYLWFAELKKKAVLSHDSFDLETHQGVTIDEPESLFLNKERRTVLRELLGLLRTNCKDVLMHWANGFSMVEIAEKLNYQSEGMARKKKVSVLRNC
ncbi:MAG: sigma-70 family RNA polymerase sigma factor [Saprospiraceae bacterium]|nr:sigma-70 family RNA polymerase sigma factor [Candidatus Defluviibacterium haderslevense]